MESDGSIKNNAESTSAQHDEEQIGGRRVALPNVRYSDWGGVCVGGGGHWSSVEDTV